MGETINQRQKSCEERIDSHYFRALEEIRKVAGIDEIEPSDLEDYGVDIEPFLENEDAPEEERELDQDEAREELRERWEEGILSVDRKEVVRVCFSWGGPADYIDIYIDPEDKSIYRAAYIFQDWFDGAEREITGTDLEAVENVFSWLVHE
jgi:hypothetical protein